MNTTVDTPAPTTDASKILVSACLVGEPVRFDGRDRASAHPHMARWAQQGRLLPVCPECAGGLGVPRPPAEIITRDGQAAQGADVFAGRAIVHTRAGAEVSDAFMRGAEHALALAREHGVRVAILKERSPSCGSSFVYDGSFSGKPLPGAGVTTHLLREAGIEVFSEDQIDAAAARLEQIQRAADTA
ncbi:DUF523 domain-containing protein [Haliangium ochraceum]|uniref:Uncharacterized protein n=1 Tax=Haliangium ochraceum (strain DSM 14365 / JCM 11303 / SMP-2) TaxID=502025 RepID=D0LL94_HALO1|nr:DUF523 domain-containing protein [Haliangium ochraceum]ACY18590.1 protein of unknown function DUF523 [Haliangium ochraceum DSM 14365]